MPRAARRVVTAAVEYGTAATSRSAAEEIEDLLRSAGFTQARTETLPLSPPVICVLAERPGPET
jgi:hypothetical protein